MTEQPQSESDPLDAYRAQAVFCKTMGHPVRLQILDLLTRAGQEVASAELLRRTGVAKPCLSQHLARMVAAGLIRTRRVGRYLQVALTCPEVGVACRQVRAALMQAKPGSHEAGRASPVDGETAAELNGRSTEC